MKRFKEVDNFFKINRSQIDNRECNDILDDIIFSNIKIIRSDGKLNYKKESLINKIKSDSQQNKFDLYSEIKSIDIYKNAFSLSKSNEIRLISFSQYFNISTNDNTNSGIDLLFLGDKKFHLVEVKFSNKNERAEVAQVHKIIKWASDLKKIDERFKNNLSNLNNKSLEMTDDDYDYISNISNYFNSTNNFIENNKNIIYISGLIWSKYIDYEYSNKEWLTNDIQKINIVVYKSER